MLNTDWTEVEVIELLIDNATQLGFGMCGSKSTGVIVRCITPGGAAELDGRLRLGDHIICIRDYNVRSYGPDQVATVLRQTISNCLSDSLLTQDSMPTGDAIPKTTIDYHTSVIRMPTSTTHKNTSTLNNTTDKPLEKSSLSPSQYDSNPANSGETHDSNKQLINNPTILIRLIVARPANGDPAELNEISLKQQTICHQHGVLGMLAIIPTHQLDQYIDLLLQNKLPLVDLYSLHKTDLLNIENHVDNLKQVKSNDVDYFATMKTINNDIEVECIEMNKINDTSTISLQQHEQSDLDNSREIEPCSTLQVVTSSANSSESDVEQSRTNLPNKIIRNDHLDDHQFDKNSKFNSNTTLNDQHCCHIDHSISSCFNPNIPEHTNQHNNSTIHTYRKHDNDDQEKLEEIEIYTVQLIKSKNQSLGLSVVGYIYKNPYDENAYNRGIFVRSIIPNSVSDKCKLIEVNDQIIQVNEVSLIGLDNLEAISILKKSNEIITLKLKRYLCGYLYEELKKAGSYKMNNNNYHSLLLNRLISNNNNNDEISDSDFNSDQPYSINNNNNNNTFKYNVIINSETSDSSSQSAPSRHEKYPYSTNHDDRSITLYVELTEEFIDSPPPQPQPCTCLHDHDSSMILQNTTLMMILSDEEEKEIEKDTVLPLLLNNDDLNSAVLSDQSVNNTTNCKLLNIESVEHQSQTPVPKITNQTTEEFIKLIDNDDEVDENNETLGMNSFTSSNSDFEIISKLVVHSQNTTLEKISNVLVQITDDDDDDDINYNGHDATIESKLAIDESCLDHTEQISTSNDEQIQIVMHIKRRLRRYISNIISFTNSHTRNALRDRSADFYANEVTDELVDLMRKVWLPIVGPGYDIIVLHIHKSHGISNLGISIEGITYVVEPDFSHENLSSINNNNNNNNNNHSQQIENTTNSTHSQLPNGFAKSIHSNNDDHDNHNNRPSRHFIQYIVPDGLIGSLGVVQIGDEILQANGHRIHGTSHTSTLRYLRHLPSRIELVLARKKSTHENVTIDMLNNNTTLKDQFIDPHHHDLDESPLEVAASEIGSVDTAASLKIANGYGGVGVGSSSGIIDRPVYSSPVSPATAYKRVTEWIHKSQGDLTAPIPYPSSPESSSIMEQGDTQSERGNNLHLNHTHLYTNNLQHNYVNSDHTDKLPQQQYSANTMKNQRKYSLPNTTLKTEGHYSKTLGRLSSTSRSLKKKESTEQQQQQQRQYDQRRYQTLPHYHSHSRSHRIDPRYGFKRPCWSSVPLIIQLNKTSHGFGFSIAEYEELPVTDLESKTHRKSFSLDRKRSHLIESDRRSFRSYYSNGSTITSSSSLTSTSLLRKHSKSSNRLKRRSTWSSRSSKKTHGILLIDSLAPGGIAQLDGRISIGDRLLFVNDKNLMKSSVNEAAHTLKSLPNGPCLIGIAKMLLESNEINDGMEARTQHTQPQHPQHPQQSFILPYPSMSTTTTMQPSVIGMFPDNHDEAQMTSMKSDLTYPLYVNTTTGDGGTIINDDNNTIVNSFNTTGMEDLALDFYTLPLLCPNPQLHASDLQYVSPVDPKFEVTKRLERGSLPIGLKLDALACHGQDGCRVLQVLGGGAVARDQLLVTNDYVTSLNGLPMRYLDNLKAFQILHSLSQNSAVIDISYIPASIIESHRMQCLSKTMNQPNENVLQKNSIPYSSIVQPLNWSAPIEIVLHRLDTSQPWGLIVSGPDICSTLNCSRPVNIENPSIISEILPNSVGKNCKLLSCGLLILQIQGMDVSSKGASYVNAYLQHLSDQLDLREIHLIVCHFNDDEYMNTTTAATTANNDTTANQMDSIKQPNITTVTTTTTSSSDKNNKNLNNGYDFTDKLQLSNNLTINTSSINDHILMPARISPSSSDMEHPEPLTDMESRDVVDILSGSLASLPDANHSSDSQHTPHHRKNYHLVIITIVIAYFKR
ncbi:unnamed protein product [Schistosoma turkestanicum]|nr:unnamed protein product [Schistosoma turkestanicum]